MNPEALCPCGSGAAFRDCHRITPDHPEAQRYWRIYGGDLRRWNAELAGAWRDYYRRQQPGPAA